MAGKPLVAPTGIELDQLVKHFTDNERLVSGFLNAVLAHIDQSEVLKKLVHSMKSRIKDPGHLKDKLVRKAKEAADEKRSFDITKENLFRKINDLAGIRLLHLHTTQFAEIDKELRSIILEQKFRLLEGPFARTWDDEYRDYFKALGVKPQKSPTLYTSVHYIVASGSQTTVTCEIQVRTLMEEVWGEVDHTINYPNPAKSVACREQIRALARATSSATRLVDSIFATVKDLAENPQAESKTKK